MKKKTVMVTGASGFIGSNFIEKYKEEYNIIPVCLIKNRPEDLDFTGVDTILHLAALVHQMKGAPEEKYFEINTRLTERLAKKAKEHGVKHFIFYSTVKVYGYDGDLENHDFILTENSPCNPNDPYGVSKYEAEKILQKLKDEIFKVAIIRPALVYGKGVKGNMLSLIKLVDRCPVLPFNYTYNRRTVVGIENILYMTKLIIDKEVNGIYIGSDLKEVSIKDIIEAMENKLNKKRLKIKIPSLIFKILCFSHKKIMVRIYGSLMFKQSDNYMEIGYKKEKLKGLKDGI